MFGYDGRLLTMQMQPILWAFQREWGWIVANRPLADCQESNSIFRLAVIATTACVRTSQRMPITK